MREPAVLVVGSANVDFAVRVPRLPVAGETVLGGALGRFFGGKGANQAVAAARAGARVRLICRLGDDEAGAAYRRHLRKEGIAPEGMLPDDGATGVALIAVDARGRNQIVVAPEANRRLTARSLRGREKLLDSGDAVLAQLEVPLEAVRLAFRRARARGAVTVLNPAPAAKPLSRALLGQVDVLVPNETEAAALLGRKRAPATERALWRSCGALLGLGPGAVVLTAGARGALFREEAGGGWVRPPKKIRAVDTTGAGDAFCGALAVGLAEGWALADAVRFATAAAALSVQKKGAQTGLARRPAIFRRMRGLRVSPVRAG